MKKQLYHMVENNGGGALPASEPSGNPSPKHKIGDVVFFLNGKIHSAKITGISTFIGTKHLGNGKIETPSKKEGIVNYYTENGVINEFDCFSTKKELVDVLLDESCQC